LEKSCDFKQATLFVCVLCETSWQQTMQDEYKKGSSKAKKDMFVVCVEIVLDCVKWEACRDR
jgi:predicted metal-binding protein